MRKLELSKRTLTLKDTEIDGFLDRTITKLGTSAKVDCPRRFIGQHAYLIICKKTHKTKQKH